MKYIGKYIVCSLKNICILFINFWNCSVYGAIGNINNIAFAVDFNICSISDNSAISLKGIKAIFLKQSPL